MDILETLLALSFEKKIEVREPPEDKLVQSYSQMSI